MSQQQEEKNYHKRNALISRETEIEEDNQSWLEIKDDTVIHWLNFREAVDQIHQEVSCCNVIISSDPKAEKEEEINLLLRPNKGNNHYDINHYITVFLDIL